MYFNTFQHVCQTFLSTNLHVDFLYTCKSIFRVKMLRPWMDNGVKICPLINVLRLRRQTTGFKKPVFKA